MSKITNDVRLTYFMGYPYGNSGRQRVDDRTGKSMAAGRLIRLCVTDALLSLASVPTRSTGEELDQSSCPLVSPFTQNT